MIIILFEDVEDKGAARDNPSPPEKSNAERSASWFERASAWIFDTIGIERNSSSENDPAEDFEEINEKIR